LILSDSLSIKRFHLVAKRARGLLLKFQRRPRPNHSRHLKSSNADPPNQPWRTFFGGKIKVEALEKECRRAMIRIVYRVPWRQAMHKQKTA
jgi:hypothetical protein